MNKPSVTVLGLGLLGHAVARTFLDAGHPTTVWNRTAAKADDLVAAGAGRAADPVAAAQASDLVVLVVLDQAAAGELLAAMGETLAGRTVVNLTNGTPEQARELDTLVRGFGARYLDGGVMAVPPMIGSREALILYSGAADAFAEHRATLDVLATPDFVDTDPGTAALYDLALLSAMYGMFGGVYHALAMISNAGIKTTEFGPRIETWLQAMLSVVREGAEEVDSDHFATDVSNLAMNDLIFPNFFAASEELGVRTDFLEPHRRLMAEAVAAGYGGDSLMRVVTLLRRPPGNVSASD
ncbi:NAD(P)-dependent oxidoreductase [Nonomuraea sp. NPDC050328]|uniref:NAD(P)-dependent oxidoreductase n=1 Tax=Nonomuraea sp. NPDC050328 TaxID=3364361 RepID=UPI0037BBC5A9